MPVRHDRAGPSLFAAMCTTSATDSGTHCVHSSTTSATECLAFCVHEQDGSDPSLPVSHSCSPRTLKSVFYDVLGSMVCSSLWTQTSQHCGAHITHCWSSGTLAVAGGHAGPSPPLPHPLPKTPFLSPNDMPLPSCLAMLTVVWRR